MQDFIYINTSTKNGLYDLTKKIECLVAASGVKTGFVNIYAQGATAAVMIQENWDESVQSDVVNLFNKLIPNGVWEHDKQDGNGDSHLKAGLVGPSESIPIINGNMGLSTWQNIFFCEFDGPRENRSIVVTIFNAE